MAGAFRFDVSGGFGRLVAGQIDLFCVRGVRRDEDILADDDAFVNVHVFYGFYGVREERRVSVGGRG